MSDDIVLLPCPFCGGKPFIHRRRDNTFHIECGEDDCLMECVAAFADTQETAAAAWNHRAVITPERDKPALGETGR